MLKNADVYAPKAYFNGLNKEQTKYLKWFHKVGKKYGIDLISCTKDSPINEEVRYYDLDYALMTSQEKVPKLDIKISHATELDPPVELLRALPLAFFVDTHV